MQNQGQMNSVPFSSYSSTDSKRTIDCGGKPKNFFKKRGRIYFQMRAALIQKQTEYYQRAGYLKIFTQREEEMLK